MKELIAFSRTEEQIFLIIKEYRNVQSFPIQYAKKYKEVIYDSIPRDSYEESYLTPLSFPSPANCEYSPFEASPQSPTKFNPLQGDLFRGEFECCESDKDLNEPEFEALQCNAKLSPSFDQAESIPDLNFLLNFSSEIDGLNYF